jgi:5-formyltetrahydrofolate cyclo-ligase
VPDVLIAPCLGFTATGFRLGYGGGYYDRYLGKHPDICALGAAWDEGLLGPEEFSPQSHDVPFVAVFTPSHTWGE